MESKRSFYDGFETTDALISELSRRAEELPAEQRAIFSQALEELQVSLEELQAMGEELSQQAEELNEAHLAAEEERRRYLSLFTLAPDAYIVTDFDGTIVEANERAGALFRVPAASLLRKPLVVFVEKSDRKAFFAQLGRLPDSGRLENWEIYFRPRRGNPFPAHVDITAIRGPKDRLFGFRWLIRDASEIKRQEKLARLATYPELNPLPVAEVDVSGHIYYCNRTARRLFRNLPEEGAGHPWLAGIGEAATKLRKSRKKSTTLEVQVGDRWFLNMIWSVAGDERLRVYGREITERKLAEQALRKSESDYRALVDNANSIIMRWKPGGEVTYLNPFGLAFFGYPEKEIIGRNVKILVPEKDSSGRDLSRLTDQIVAKPRAFQMNENENVLKSGKRVWVQWSNRALVDEAGNVREILAIGNDITARKRAEESLREARDYLDNLFNYANAPIIVWDAGSRITRFNRAFEDLTGLRAEEVLGRPIDILFPEAFREESLKQIRRTSAAGERWEVVEIPIRRKDGAVRTVLWNSANILEPGSARIVATIAQGQDITERKRVEEELLAGKLKLEERVRSRTAELARTTDLLERVFASVDLSIAYMDADFDFIRVNRAFAEAFGGKPESFSGKNFFALFPDPEREAVFRRVLETGEPYIAFEKPFGHAGEADRGPSYWDWSLQPVTEGRTAVGLVLSLVDVTPRIQAEEERRRLSTAVEQSGEAIVITDPSLRILYANRAFQNIHGLSRPDLLGRPLGDILRFADEDVGFRQGIEQALARGEIWKARLTRTLGGLPDRKLDVAISPVRDPSGRIVNYAALERDMTHENKLEGYVRQVQKMDALGTLAGGIAHDFNNILVPIFINAELAAFEVARDSATAKHLDLILQAAGRGRELVKQIISFSKPNEPQRQLVDMNAIVREAVRFLQSTIPKSITVRERIEPPSSMVRADPTQLQQVLMNLGGNAAHAMRERGGCLDIGLSEVLVGPDAAALNPDLKPGSYVKLTVEDTGCGMNREIQERIFEPFFTTKPHGEGAGMGLPVVMGIVKGHGGAIAVSSRPDLGTIFEVYIPVASGSPKPAAGAAEQPFRGEGRVLFVDDEEILVRTIPIMLEKLGFTVTASSSPREALAVFRREPGDFRLVITDQTMPGITGEKLAREMLRIRPDIPIILCTGYSEVVREDEIRGLGVRGFIMKPFSTAEIAEKIRDALKEP